MADRERHIIDRLKKDWTSRLIVSSILIAVAGTIISSVLILKIFTGGWIWISAAAALSAIVSYYLCYTKISSRDVSSYLDKTQPVVEESTWLLEKPESELNYFERRQVDKIKKALPEKIALPPAIRKKWNLAIGSCIGALAFAFVMYLIPVYPTQLIPSSQQNKPELANETKLPGISKVSITVLPPAYTSKPSRKQERFNIEAEEGGTIEWSLSTSMPADSLLLVFNDSAEIVMKPGPEKTSWSAKKVLRASGFYRVKLGEQLSEFYRLDMIKDQLPEITVHAPASNSTIEPGMLYKTLVDVSIHDDYAISSTAIVATIASGSGESVAFREQRIPFGGFASGRTAYRFNKTIDLQQLKMAAGDELYFYVSATDNHNQEKRSDVFIVRIEDTAQLMSLEGLASGIDIKPEYFRSQRQIIIETEQLLKDQGSMSKEAFSAKSNDLGTDQKLLRLRYGKFLGEETDAEIGGHEHEGDEKETDVGAIMDSYTHQHDNSEDASFFDAETKKQLKATLAEMWKAELQLRTIKPRDALPFEYKALRLLKDLQHKTRAYVSKTGIKTTPLDPGKRLTADLGGIQQPVAIRKKGSLADEVTMLRQALGALEELRSGEKISNETLAMLQAAQIKIGEQASREPGKYLQAFSAMNRILKNEFNPADLDQAGMGIMRAINITGPSPVKSKSGPDIKLSDRYFKKISVIHE